MFSAIKMMMMRMLLLLLLMMMMIHTIVVQHTKHKQRYTHVVNDMDWL